MILFHPEKKINNDLPWVETDLLSPYVHDKKPNPSLPFDYPPIPLSPRMRSPHKRQAFPIKTGKIYHQFISLVKNI
jgi:hypothetical protein